MNEQSSSTAADTIVRAMYPRDKFPNLLATRRDFHSVRHVRAVVENQYPAAAGTSRITTLFIDGIDLNFFDFAKGEEIKILTPGGTVSMEATIANTNLEVRRRVAEGCSLAIDTISCVIETPWVSYTAAPAVVAGSNSVTEALMLGNMPAPSGGLRRAVFADPAGLIQPATNYSDNVPGPEQIIRDETFYTVATQEQGKALLSGNLRDIGPGERGPKRGGFGDQVNSTEKKLQDGLVWSNVAARNDADLYFKLFSKTGMVFAVANPPSYPGASTYLTIAAATVAIRVTVSGWYYAPNNSANS